jgi:hypothetical protein
MEGEADLLRKAESRRAQNALDGTLTSFHVSLRSRIYLVMRTVKTERHMVTIAIQATKLTTGPLLLEEIWGVRPTRPWVVAMLPA